MATNARGEEPRDDIFDQAGILDDEVDVRKFFTFDRKGVCRLLRFSIQSTKAARLWAISARPNADSPKQTLW